MRRGSATILLAPALIAALFAGTPGARGAEPTVAAPALPDSPPPPIPSPFGPGHDPTRPLPEEPQPHGAGIVAATLVVAGSADVEELRGADVPAASPLFAAVVDVRIAAGSTTATLGAASVVARPEAGSAVPLYGACVPDADPPLSVYHVPAVWLREWHVAVGGRTFYCGGRTERLAVLVATGGVRLTNTATEAWHGSVLLLFRPGPDVLRRVELPGATVELPAPKQVAGDGR